MPEGPEIWILSQAINNYYNFNECYYIGKHIIVNNIIWSFGLNGIIQVNDQDVLVKPVENNWMNGINQEGTTFQSSKFDWLTTTDLTLFVQKLKKSQSKIGPYLINQKNISGIGIAYGSEILHRANLHPNTICSNLTNSVNLLQALYEVRQEIMQFYQNELLTYSNKKRFINSWFYNLYQIRPMKIYKKGNQVKISGRTWYV